jgi:hypothetical protein
MARIQSEYLLPNSKYVFRGFLCYVSLELGDGNEIGAGKCCIVQFAR